MRFRHFSCALILLFAATCHSFADVTYSYVAENSSYTGTPGQIVDVKLYLQENVTATSSGGRNATTSIINMAFQTPDQSSAYTGVATVGLGVNQTGLSAGGTTSQIQGPSVFTPGGAKAGVQNNAGWNFATAFQYTYNSSGSKTGGAGVSSIYQNLTDNLHPAFSGNNIQIVAGLNGTSAGGFDPNFAVPTDATITGGGTYGSGRVLVGTLHIMVQNGTTSFEVVPLALSSLTGKAGTVSAVNNNTAISSTGTNSALNGSKVSTILATQAFNLQKNSDGSGVTNNVYLDQTYQGNPYVNETGTSVKRQDSATFDTYNNVNDANAFTGPTAGPSHAPATSSFLPFYNASATPFTFTVAAVPEPSSMALCGLITAAGAAYGVKRRRKAIAA